MGYNVHQVDSKFHMDADNIIAAMQAIKSLSLNFSWVPDNLQNINDFSEMMGSWMWDIERDGEDNVIGIQFEGDSMGDEDALFGAIAAFVKAGSYIDMAGEDGERWRLAFDGTKCENKSAKISYD